jgi:hypothetical protein
MNADADADANQAQENDTNGHDWPRPNFAESG